MKRLARKWKTVSDQEACLLVEPEAPAQAIREADNHHATPATRGWIIRVEREVWDDETISLEARAIYTILCGYVGKNGQNPFPKLETLVKKAGKGRKAVQKYLRELEEVGLIRIIHRHKDKNGKFLSNEYELLRPPRGVWRRGITVGQNGPTKKATPEVARPIKPTQPKKAASVT